jgi:hypothetical protein
MLVTTQLGMAVLACRLLYKIFKTVLYKTVILNECKTSSQIRERVNYLIQMFENRVLQRISGAEQDEVTGGWRKLHNEELHNLHFTKCC